MYDKYANRPLPWGYPFAPMMEDEIFEEEVLADLANTEHEWEKLEILDSYAAFRQRWYRVQVIEALQRQAGNILNSILKPHVDSFIPKVRVAKRSKESEAPVKVSSGINLGGIDFKKEAARVQLQQLLDTAKAEVERIQRTIDEQT